MQNNSPFNHVKNIVLLPVNVTIVIPFLLYRFISTKEIIDETFWMFILGVFFILFGIMLLSYTIFLFKTGGDGTLAPWNPTSKLVIRGPYRHVRNPMISGVLFVLLGEALFFNAWSILLWAMLFFIANTIYFVIKEEPGLEKRFGQEYKTYKGNVPRWIPRIKPYNK